MLYNVLRRFTKYTSLTVLFFCAHIFIACDGSPSQSSVATRPPPVYRNETVSPPDEVTSYDIYLVKVNKGSNAVDAVDSGTVAAYMNSDTQSSFSADFSYHSNEALSALSANNSNEAVITCFEPPAIQEYNSRPFNKKNVLDKIVSAISGNSSGGDVPVFTSYDVDNKKTFKVPSDGTARKTIKIPATLRAQGEHCNVWVADANYELTTDSTNFNNKIDQVQAEALRDKFDIIYVKETAILGFEYGGGPGGDGGADGDPRIQILVYDVFGDYAATQKGGTFGFFYGIDETRNDASNMAEMFYIDCHLTKVAPSMIYSTLIHEFQHMINYNQKNIKYEKGTSMWYNEMLSMVAEDMLDLDKDIKIEENGHPIITRIPTFLKSFSKTGIGEWLTDTDNDVYNSYANHYAFGAYLARNFGGAELIKLMLSNDAVDEESITAALGVCTSNTSGVKTFAAAFAGFPQSLLWTEQSAETGKFSFNNTVSNLGYTFYPFDISMFPQGLAVSEFSKKNMRGMSIDIQTCTAWKNKTGKTIVKLEVPADSNVKLYLYAIPH
ncbi:MAG: hypothetical protein Ta2B_06510 [Termitinemataceae bacterium]|nr:MAG: hypothetical protein Ta2B_06510 [Termitinemataceae bacterium]